jgi:hypothetical protein
MQEGFLMNNVSLDFLNSNVLMDDDEIDEMFTQMLHINPPASMMENIMQAVSALPQLQALSRWRGFDLFVAAEDIAQLS